MTALIPLLEVWRDRIQLLRCAPMPPHTASNLEGSAKKQLVTFEI